MAKTLDELVKDALGHQVFEILRLQADNEALKAQIAELHKAAKSDESAPANV